MTEHKKRLRRPKTLPEIGTEDRFVNHCREVLEQEIKACLREYNPAEDCIHIQIQWDPDAIL
jgi:hypothetical protein